MAFRVTPRYDAKMMNTETEQAIYTVSELNQAVRYLLEEAFPFVWVEGEISNFAAPQSGHWYFSLKDKNAQVRCAMFRGQQRKLLFSPKDGTHVLIKARVSLYENRGEFQLVAEEMEERGEGKLRQAFELLKKKLEAAGLFDPIHKKPIPRLPRQIGIITSPTGAAIRDILTVLKRRFPLVPIILYPTLVQGKTAAPAIAEAIKIANQRQECDVLILARGGGSLEDLWSFNEEVVAQAIFQSHLPVISGVGHQVDFTIADFVADVRAPTPSAAAELAVPDQTELFGNLTQQQQNLLKIVQVILHQYQQQLNWTHKHLSQQHPQQRLLEKMQRLDYLEMQLVQLQQQRLTKTNTLLNQLIFRLHHQTPLHIIQQYQQQLHLNLRQLEYRATQNLNKTKTSLTHAAATLDALSPLATLKRGFAIATHQTGQVLTNTSATQIDEVIDVKLNQGHLRCRVEEINPFN